MFLERRWLMINFTRILAWALLASLVYTGACNGAAINVPGLNDSVEYFKTEYDAQKRVLDLAQLEKEQFEKEELNEKGEPNHVMFINPNEKPNETIAKPIDFSDEKNILLTNKENTEESFKENTFEEKPQPDLNGDIIQETLNLNGRNILPVLSENNLGEVANESNISRENEEVVNETNNSQIENNNQNSDNGKNMPEMRENDKTLLEEAVSLGTGARNLSGEGLENSNEENESHQKPNNFNGVQTQIVHQNEGSREAITEQNLTDSQSETRKQISTSDLFETNEKENLRLEDTISLGMQQRNLSGDGSENLSNEDKESSQEQNTLNNVQPQPVAQNEGSGDAITEQNLTDSQTETKNQISTSDLFETNEKENLQLEDTVSLGMQQRNLSGDGSENLSNEDKESSQEQNTLNNVQPQPVAQNEGSGDAITEQNLTDSQTETKNQISTSDLFETNEKENLQLEDTVSLGMQQRNLSGDGSENLSNEDKESSQEQNTLNNVQPQPVAQNEESGEAPTERNLTNIDDYQPETTKQVLSNETENISENQHYSNVLEKRSNDEITSKQKYDSLDTNVTEDNQLQSEHKVNLSNTDMEISSSEEIKPSQIEGILQDSSRMKEEEVDKENESGIKFVLVNETDEKFQKDEVNKNQQYAEQISNRSTQKDMENIKSDTFLNYGTRKYLGEIPLTGKNPEEATINTSHHSLMDPNVELDQERSDKGEDKPHDNENNKQPSEMVEMPVNEENKNINTNNNGNGIQEESETEVPNKDQFEENPEDKAPPSPPNRVLSPATNEDTKGPNTFGKLTFSDNTYNNDKGANTLPQHDNTPKNVVDDVNFVANIERRINVQSETPVVYDASINSSNTQSSETSLTLNDQQETEPFNLEKENVKTLNERDIKDAQETSQNSGLHQVENNNFENSPRESQIERPPKNNLEKESDVITNNNVQNTKVSKEINPKLALQILKEAIIQTMPFGNEAVQQASILPKNEESTNEEERSSFNSMSKSSEHNGESDQNVFPQFSKDKAQEEKSELTETQVNEESAYQGETNNETQISEFNTENGNNSLEKKDVSNALYSALGSLQAALSEIKSILPSYFKVGETNNESTSRVVQTLNNKEPISSARVSTPQNTLPLIKDMVNNNNVLESSDLKEKRIEDKDETLLKINNNSEELYNKKPANESEEYDEQHKLGEETSTTLTDKPMPQNFIEETEKSTIFNSFKNISTTSRQNESDGQEQIQRQGSETMELNKEGGYVMGKNEEQKDLVSEEEKTSTDRNGLLNRQGNEEIDGRAKVINDDTVQEKRNTEENQSESENMKDYFSPNKTEEDISKDYKRKEDLTIKEDEKISSNKLTSDLDTSTANKSINSNETFAGESSVSLDSKKLEISDSDEEAEGKLHATKDVKNDDYLTQSETNNALGEPDNDRKEKNVILIKHHNDDTTQDELTISESNRTINSENSTQAQNNVEENTVKEHEDSVGVEEKNNMQGDEQPKNLEKYNNKNHLEPNQEDTQLLLEKIDDERISHKENPQPGISESRIENSKEVDGGEKSNEDTKEGELNGSSSTSKKHDKKEELSFVDSIIKGISSFLGGI